MGGLQKRQQRNRQEIEIAGRVFAPGNFLKLIYVFYDGSYAVFSYAYASLFYDAFFFYHTAYVLKNFIDCINYLLKSPIRFSISSRSPGTLLSGKLF